MRQIHPTLASAQAKPTVKPAIYIQVGDYGFRLGDSASGGTTSCHNTSAISPTWTKDRASRILSVETMESPWKCTGTIVLSNYDGLLDDLSVVGHRIYIAWGAQTIDGPLFSTAAAMRVWSVKEISYEGVVAKQIDCLGIADFLGKDEADSKYTADGVLHIGDLIEDAFDSTMTCFTECKAYNVIYDNATDALYDDIIVGSSFEVVKGASRSATLARLFDLTEVVWKPGSEQPDADGHDTIHIFIPNKTTYDFTYSLDPSDHRFYVVQDSESFFMPNQIIIKSPADSGDSYIGRARSAREYNTYPKTRTEYIAGLDSNVHAQQIAQTMLNNIAAYSNASSVKVPMTVNAEIYDRICVTDARSGKTFSGNLGSIKRTFKANKAQYDMECTFGKWYDPRALSDALGIGSGFVGTEDIASSIGSSSHSVVAVHSVSDLTGSWQTGSSGQLSSSVNGDSLTYKVYLSAGSYRLYFMALHSSSAGILVCTIDGTSIGSSDLYYSGAQYYGPATWGYPSAFSIATSGWKTITFTITDKNLNSSGYTASLLVGFDIFAS